MENNSRGIGKMVNLYGTVDFNYRKKLKALSPTLECIFKEEQKANDFTLHIDALIKKSKRRFKKGDSNLCLCVILTQLKIWDPDDRNFILDLYNFNDINEDCYDYKRALAIGMKIRNLNEFKELQVMLKN